MTPSTLSALAERELSVKARAGHVALLLAGLCMSIITASLWLTELQLPLRTAIAFAAMTVIGLCWAAYAAWTLTRRQPLLAFHRVVATRMAFTFCSAATAGSLYLALVEERAAAWPASIAFATMTLLAAILLAQARRRYHQLHAHKEQLEQRLGQKDNPPPR